MRAVEFLVPLAVLFRELNHEFEVRAMKACVSLDRPGAARKICFKYDVSSEQKRTPPPPEPSINEPSIIAAAPHLTHSITSEYPYPNKMSLKLKRSQRHP